MKLPTQQALESLRARYRPGMRVEMVHMDDPHAPPAGTRGTLIAVDGIGDLVIAWDNGSGLKIIPDVDAFKVLRDEPAPDDDEPAPGDDEPAPGDDAVKNRRDAL